MGSINTKSNKNESENDDEIIQSGLLPYDTRKIYYDNDGNLRYDKDASIKQRDDEIRSILEVDSVDLVIDDKTWYAIDTAWLTAWLAYAYYDKDISPNPGPCYNHRLITLDSNNEAYVMKSNLTMASPTWKGDYRRVSEETWNTFKSIYPNSGPTITFKHKITIGDNNNKSFEATDFVIVDPPEIPIKHDHHHHFSLDIIKNSSFSLSMKSIYRSNDSVIDESSSKPLIDSRPISPKDTSNNTTINLETEVSPLVINRDSDSSLSTLSMNKLKLKRESPVSTERDVISNNNTVSSNVLKLPNSNRQSGDNYDERMKSKAQAMLFGDDS